MTSVTFAFTRSECVTAPVKDSVRQCYFSVEDLLPHLTSVTQQDCATLPTSSAQTLKDAPHPHMFDCAEYTDIFADTIPGDLSKHIDRRNGDNHTSQTPEAARESDRKCKPYKDDMLCTCLEKTRDAWSRALLPSCSCSESPELRMSSVETAQPCTLVYLLAQACTGVPRSTAALRSAVSDSGVWHERPPQGSSLPRVYVAAAGGQNVAQVQSRAARRIARTRARVLLTAPVHSCYISLAPLQFVDRRSFGLPGSIADLLGLTPGHLVGGGGKAGRTGTSQADESHAEAVHDQLQHTTLAGSPVNPSPTPSHSSY
ncbi:hypothetical protein OPT61_g6860 [Boeremia exigua]|uniref:Uncharacterized protein n=1 Tax=Boeremia exigua TaxID=749465 RepID=A0ACC2I4R4_9PLEO|nr:hypothetical protein OPT61_g6860 [Boeremia exigua]